jgi:hypothetical protein
MAMIVCSFIDILFLKSELISDLELNNICKASAAGHEESLCPVEIWGKTETSNLL